MSLSRDAMPAEKFERGRDASRRAVETLRAPGLWISDGSVDFNMDV